MTLTLLTFQDRGACRDHDPELFFPVSETDANTGQIEQAKAVCAGCPVLVDCRAYALATGPDGIWGGMTEGERRAIRAWENRAAAAAHADTGQDGQHEAEQPVGEDTPQPESSPTLPSYQASRQSLTRARRALDLAEQTGDAAALTRAEQRVAAAEQQFAAVRTHATAEAVA